MTVYQILLSILDQIRKDAPAANKRYHPDASRIDMVDAARSRALVHLFLKVRFGVTDFGDREQHLTDGKGDGGIDGYFIDKHARKIYFIQSKFRTNETNFKERHIKTDELLKMEIDRVAKGLTSGTDGTKYNGKIQRLIRDISSLSDISRYDFVVVLLANLRQQQENNLHRLFGRQRIIEQFDYRRCYTELVFPVVSGTYYSGSDLYIDIDLSKVDSQTIRIKYPVQTDIARCEITILFVPTREIARIMLQYKNSILKYNPRSYLSLSNNVVNREIADTILNKSTNEFALYNNGITMLSDRTKFTDDTGRESRGQLHVKNPQIINGGQTAYTLGYIYDQHASQQDLFDNKEVLLKVITFQDPSVDQAKRLRFIEAISKATNQQTSVIEADRRSNEQVQVELQRLVFADYGRFYERKKGEFFDGLANKYITNDLLIDRDTFLRTAIAAAQKPDAARRTSKKELFKEESFKKVLQDANDYRRLFLGYLCYNRLNEVEKGFKTSSDNKFGVNKYGNALRYGKFAVISVALRNVEGISLEASSIENSASVIIDRVLSQWLAFESYALTKDSNREYFRKSLNPQSQEEVLETNFDSYYKVQNVNNDLQAFFGQHSPTKRGRSRTK